MVSARNLHPARHLSRLKVRPISLLNTHARAPVLGVLARDNGADTLIATAHWLPRHKIT